MILIEKIGMAQRKTMNTQQKSYMRGLHSFLVTRTVCIEPCEMKTQVVSVTRQSLSSDDCVYKKTFYLLKIKRNNGSLAIYNDINKSNVIRMLLCERENLIFDQKCFCKVSYILLIIGSKNMASIEKYQLFVRTPKVLTIRLQIYKLMHFSNSCLMLFYSVSLQHIFFQF